MFGFQFINCYFSLFYVAFFKRYGVRYSDTIYDKCEPDACMEELEVNLTLTLPLTHTLPLTLPLTLTLTLPLLPLPLPLPLPLSRVSSSSPS